jgi:acyl-CoA synthetase (AMP-forming)/AMP-acid ligase II
MDPRFSQVDLSHSPPRVTVPRRYNAAVDLLDRNVEEGRGDRVAVLDDTGAYTYRQLAARANRFGNALRALGVRQEERVALCMLDTADFPACILGAIRAGAVPVLLNTLLQPHDYGFMLGDCRARVVVVSDALLPRVGPALAQVEGVEHVLVAKTPAALGPAPAHDLRTLDAALAAASDTLEAADTTSDDPAFWLYSSGSTGAPKGAVHLHSHLVQTAALYGRGVLGIREDDVVFSAAKLFFAYGLGNSLTFPFSVGARGADGRAGHAPRGARAHGAAPAEHLLRRAHALRRAAGRPRVRAADHLAAAARLHLGGRGAPQAPRREVEGAVRHRHPRRHRLHRTAPHLPLQPARRRHVRHHRQARPGLPGAPRHR